MNDMGRILQKEIKNLSLIFQVCYMQDGRKSERFCAKCVPQADWFEIAPMAEHPVSHRKFYDSTPDSDICSYISFILFCLRLHTFLNLMFLMLNIMTSQKMLELGNNFAWDFFILSSHHKTSNIKLIIA